MTRAKRSIHTSARRWLLAGAMLLLTALAVFISALVERQSQTLFDQMLQSRLQALAANVEQETDGIEFDIPEALLLSYSGGLESDYFELRDSVGKPLARSPSLESSPGAMDLPFEEAPLGTVRFDAITLPDGRPGRMITSQFLPRLDTPDPEDGQDAGSSLFPPGFQATPVFLSVASSHQPYLDLVLRTRLSLLVGLSMSLAALAWWVQVSLKRGLAPLTEIRAQIASLEATQLHTRLAPTRQCQELAPIVAQINLLLDRLEQAFTHERQFTQDVAHELRTPMAELATLAEVSARWPGDEAMRSRFFDSATETIKHLEQLLSNLLALARSERDLELVDQSSFDLVATSERIAAGYRDHASRRGLVLIRSGDQHCQASHGLAQWLQIMRNLIGNAVEHSLASTPISIEVKCHDGRFKWSISNQTIDLTQEDVPNLFNRMWRKDTGRANRDHAGLGLALVRAYARQLGLELQSTLDDQSRLTIAITGRLANTTPDDSASL